jgi:hypothetical protein
VNGANSSFLYFDGIPSNAEAYLSLTDATTQPKFKLGLTNPDGVGDAAYLELQQNDGVASTAYLFSSGMSWIDSTEINYFSAAATGVHTDEFVLEDTIGNPLLTATPTDITHNVPTTFIDDITSSHIYPDITLSRSLGSSLKRWLSIYVDDAQLLNVTADDILCNGLTTLMNCIPATDNLYDLGSALYRWQDLYVVNIAESFTVSGNILPAANNSYDLGSSSFLWNDVYCTNAFISYLQNASDIIYAYVSLLPNTSLTYDLGSSTRIWNNLYTANLRGSSSIITSYASIRPDTSLSLDLGSSSYLWNNLYLANLRGSSSNITCYASLKPDTTATYDLGSNTLKWNAFYSKNISDSGTAITLAVVTTVSAALTVNASTTGQHFLFSANATYDIGSNTNSADEIYCRGLRSNSSDKVSCENFYAYAHNTYTIGNTSTRYAEIWSVNALNTSSDLKLKKDIDDSDLGLNFILKIKPKKYRFKIGQYKAIKDADGNVTTIPQEGKRFHYGVIAQQVEESLIELGKTTLDFAGVCKDKDENGDDFIYSMRYTEFISPIIKSIQELHEKINTLRVDVNTLMKKDTI